MATAITAHPKRAALLIDAAGHQSRVVISTIPFTIGRADECDATITDLRISRVHARIVMEQGQYFIVDAGSRHGTFVNGERHERAQLKNNDEIRLGAGARIISLPVTPGEATPATVFSHIWLPVQMVLIWKNSVCFWRPRAA